MAYHGLYRDAGSLYPLFTAAEGSQEELMLLLLIALLYADDTATVADSMPMLQSMMATMDEKSDSGALLSTGRRPMWQCRGLLLRLTGAP